MLPCPISSTVFGCRQGDAGRRVDRIGEILADEVALDQVADVGGIGDRDADAEAFDGQAAQDAVGRVDHKADVARRHSASGSPLMITRTCALLPSMRGDRVRDRRDQGRRLSGTPPDGGRLDVDARIGPPIKLLVAIRLGIASAAYGPWNVMITPLCSPARR